MGTQSARTHPCRGFDSAPLSLWLTTRKANAFPTSPPTRSSSPGRVPSTYPYFAQNEVSSHETILHSKHQGRYRASGLSLALWLMLQTPLATCFVFSTAVLPRSQHSKAPYLLGCLAELLSWKTTSEWGRGLAGFLPSPQSEGPSRPQETCIAQLTSKQGSWLIVSLFPPELEEVGEGTVTFLPAGILVWSVRLLPMPTLSCLTLSSP